jgi:hypothetical protein
MSLKEEAALLLSLSSFTKENGTKVAVPVEPFAQIKKYVHVQIKVKNLSKISGTLD